MITDIQKKWIEEILSGKISKSDNPRKYSAYLKRIQQRIDAMIVNMAWLSDNAPDILKNEEREYDDPSFERHFRLKTMLRTCAKISPFTDDPTILKILGELLPPQVGIEIYRKSVNITQPKPLDVYHCNGCSNEFEPSEIKDGNCPYCGSKDYALIT